MLMRTEKKDDGEPIEKKVMRLENDVEMLSSLVKALDDQNMYTTRLLEVMSQRLVTLSQRGWLRGN